MPQPYQTPGRFVLPLHPSFDAALNEERQTHDALSAETRQEADAANAASHAQQCQTTDRSITQPVTEPAPEIFAAAVKGYERRIAGKIQALMPYKKGIAELRSKRASFRTIANLLKQSGIDVSHDTVTRFCHEVLSQPEKQRTTAHETDQGAKARPIAPKLPDNAPLKPDLSTITNRSKGPRIADPNSV